MKISGNLPSSVSMDCCLDISVPLGCQNYLIIMCCMVRFLPSASLTLILPLLANTLYLPAGFAGYFRALARAFAAVGAGLGFRRLRRRMATGRRSLVQRVLPLTVRAMRKRHGGPHGFGLGTFVAS